MKNMRELLPATEIVAKVLKNQNPTDGTTYRPLDYCVSVDTDEGVLVHNVLTKSLFLLSHEEEDVLNGTIVYRKDEAPDYLTKLIEARYLVPVDNDDCKMISDLRNLSRMIQAREEKKQSYTILTTTDCNARCFYCYELGRARIMMSEQTAHQVADYISKNPKVNLEWFGGEPLYNSTAIDTICKDLQAAGCEYTSRMVSNAYLFDEGTVRRAVDQWHLKWVQITLDGTEAVYNRCKAYIYKDVNPYQKVMHNIGLLLDADVKVSIRLNIDMHNAENLLLLVDELKERFGGRKGFTVYSHTIFEETLHEVRSDERRRELYAKQDILDARIRELVFERKSKLSTDIKLNHCKVDSCQSEIILPDGHIGLCEHYTDDHFIGHISTPDRDTASMAEQRATIEDPACDKCPILPNCIRLKICNVAQVCYPEDKERKINRLKDAMLAYVQDHT